MPVWAAPKATPVTFHKDVAPLLQKQCTIPNVARFDFNWQLFYNACRRNLWVLWHEAIC